MPTSERSSVKAVSSEGDDGHVHGDVREQREQVEDCHGKAL